MKKLYIFATVCLISNGYNASAQNERGNRNKDFNERGENRTFQKKPVNETFKTENRNIPVRKERNEQIEQARTNRQHQNIQTDRIVRNHNERNNQNVVINRNQQTQRNIQINRNNYTLRYNRIDRNYYPDYRRPYSYVGQRYTNFYAPRFITPYRGINYYYSAGFFYQPYNNYFQVIVAPIGIRIYALPWGYRKWYIGPDLYYYFGGTYYRNLNNHYEVVDAPLGSILPELPNGTKSVLIDGQQYFEQNGTYYKETLRNDETWYTIVGKNGKLNTNIETIKEEEKLVGDTVTDLPANCKTVILNGQKYYVSENQIYYQEYIVENNLYYKVVAKPQ